MMMIHAHHGSPFTFNRFRECTSGLHFGTFDQAVHAATLKLARLPLLEFEQIQENPRNGWRGKIYHVALEIQKYKRITDPRTPKKWIQEIRRAKEDGYDAIVYTNDFEGSVPADSYCIFDPYQVKILAID